LPVRDFECFRFGFGIMYSRLSVQFGFQFLKRGPPNVNLLFAAGTVAKVQVRAALGAKAPTLFSAQSSHRQSQLYLFAREIVYVNDPILIEA
jgi:hypothetical protein